MNDQTQPSVTQPNAKADSDVLAPVRRLDAEGQRSESPCGNGSMVWRSWGTGSALVFLHGGAGSWMHWLRNIPVFRATHRVIVPDLPGLGESADAPAGSDMAAVAAIVAKGIDGLIGTRAAYDVVGFSFGASVGGHVALKHGTRVRSLTLLGAGGLVTPHTPMTLERVRGKSGAELMEAHRTNLARTMVADPAKIDALALAMQDWNARHSRMDSPALIKLRPLAVSLPQLTIPVNAIWGERDQIAYYTLEDRIAALRVIRPGIMPRIIPAAGHWAAYEAAEMFNATLGEILRGVGD